MKFSRNYDGIPESRGQFIGQIWQTTPYMWPNDGIKQGYWYVYDRYDETQEVLVVY